MDDSCGQPWLTRSASGARRPGWQPHGQLRARRTVRRLWAHRPQDIVDTYGGMAVTAAALLSARTEQGRPFRRLCGRWVAKHVVASGAADRCEVQLAYAIGMAQPMSILVETFGTPRSTRRRSRRLCARRRPASRCHRARPRPEAPDLPEDRGLRPLRPARLPMGRTRSPRRVHGRRRRLTDAAERDCSVVDRPGPPRCVGARPGVRLPRSR